MSRLDWGRVELGGGGGGGRGSGGVGGGGGEGAAHVPIPLVSVALRHSQSLTDMTGGFVIVLSLRHNVTRTI